MNNTQMMKIMDYKTGKCLAHDVEVDGPAYDESSQQPQGICRAGDILTEYQLSELDIDSDRTIFCE